MLDRSTILAHVDAVAATVTVPELGGEVGIRRLTLGEAMALAEVGRQLGNETAAQERFLVQLVLACACDERGRRLFRDGDHKQVARLPARAVQAIADAAMEANGLAEGAVEGAVGNSAATPGGAGS